MSQSKQSNVIICANCGKPKAPPVTTQQAPARKPLTLMALDDTLYVMQRVQEALHTNADYHMEAPDPPPLVPPKEPAPALTVNQWPRAPWMAPEPPPLVP